MRNLGNSIIYLDLLSLLKDPLESEPAFLSHAAVVTSFEYSDNNKQQNMGTSCADFLSTNLLIRDPWMETKLQ